MRKSRGSMLPSLITHHSSLLLELPFANVREVAGDRRGGGHLGADKVRAPAAPLSSFKVAVARRGAALAGPQGVRVHREAHRAAGLAPLEARVAEERIKSFLFGRALHGLR